MTKLSNGIEYVNIFLPQEYAEYLISNGFKCLQLSADSLQFQTDKVCLNIKNDTADVYRFVPEMESPSQRWMYSQSHSGISQMGLFNWIMLMHIMNVQTINGFMKNAMAEGPQMATQASFILKEIHRSQLQN